MKAKPSVKAKIESPEPKPEKGFPSREKKDFNLKHPPALRPKGKRAK